MNQGQEKFYTFILERVEDGKKELAINLLEEGFKKQADGSFNNEYMQQYILRMMPLLKIKHHAEVKDIMITFQK